MGKHEPFGTLVSSAQDNTVGYQIQPLIARYQVIGVRSVSS